jgi:hypothetical protein
MRGCRGCTHGCPKHTHGHGNTKGVRVGIESVREGVEMYAGDEGGVTRAYAWVLTC